ncbi:MAG: lamin tail domain-containing protein, partial [Ferruginibacter sp.]
MKKIYVSLLLTVFLFTAKSQTTHLVISQVYGGGGNAGAPYQNDYVEIFNPTAAPVTMTSWSIQYAATAGNFNLSVSVSGTIPAGKYFLVQLATGGAVGSALPAPDATNLAINMSAANGKVALVNNTTLLGALSCPYSNAAIIDLVGYGTANASEACVAAPAGTNTTAIFRMNNGCTDSDNNAADFTTAAPNPRNSSSAANLCAGSCTTPTQGASNLRYAGSTATTMSMLFTRGNGSGAVVFCRANNAITFTPVNGSTYASNATFAAGADLGGGTYAVHNASFRNVNGFTVSGLTTGTKYFFSVYEYNDPGKCYTATGLTDSFTVGATIFKPGDFVFVGCGFT